MARSIQAALRTALALAVLAVVTVGGCGGETATTQTDAPPRAVDEYLGKLGTIVRDKQGRPLIVKGEFVYEPARAPKIAARANNTSNALQARASISLKRSTPGLLKTFRSSKAIGIGTIKPGAGDRFSFSITGLVTASKQGAGQLCVRVNGKIVDDNIQRMAGTFKVIGGTRKATRIHADGRFRAIQPKALTRASQPVRLSFRLSLKHLGKGKARPLTKACKAAGKPLPPPPKVEATFKGFAFAPASVKEGGALPAGTTLYPDNASVDGATACGDDNNLFVVIGYSGPGGAKVDGSAFGDSDGAASAPLGRELEKGDNALFLYSAPKNQHYSLKAALDPPKGYSGSADFNQGIQLSRTC